MPRKHQAPRELTVAIMLVERGDMSPADVIQEHLEWGARHNGKVLFTTGVAIGRDRRSKIKELLLLTPGGETAALATVDGVSTTTSAPQDPSYQQPERWRADNKTTVFQLSDMRAVSLTTGMYRITSTGKDVLESRWRGRVYVD